MRPFPDGDHSTRATSDTVPPNHARRGQRERDQGRLRLLSAADPPKTFRCVCRRRSRMTLGETPQARTFDGTDVNEDVGPPGLGLYESETFLRVEPFYYTGMHDMSFRRTSDWAFAACNATTIDVLERKLCARCATHDAKAKPSGRNSIGYM